MSNNMYLSVIIPSYNEAKIIKKTIEEVSGFLSKKRYSWEIVIVDDGSTDNSKEVISKLLEPGVRLVNYKPNRGKGGALKRGIKEAKGKFIIFTDADLSVPIKTIDAVLARINDGDCDVVIGTRKNSRAKVLIHQPWLRENLGKGFTLLTQIITGVNVSDFTCGFKCFTSKSAKTIFGRSLLSRWAYDAEVLFLAKKYGYLIAEIPVTWRNREDTRVQLGSAIITSFIDLLRIRWNDFLGKYSG